jgi:uncharacterized protein (DUF1697 family)
MDVFIALYRGLNVVGKNPVKMELLRAMHEGLGHRSVKTYIQSGNVVFTARGSAASIARKAAAAFADEFGFAPKLIVLSAESLSAMIAKSPYAKFAAAAPNTVHAGICDGEPTKKELTALLKKTGGTEKFAVGPGIVYLHAPDGFGTSKFAAGMEKACGVPMTVRNWRTMEGLEKLAAEVAETKRRTSP